MYIMEMNGNKLAKMIHYFKMNVIVIESMMKSTITIIKLPTNKNKNQPTTKNELRKIFEHFQQKKSIQKLNVLKIF